MASSRTPLLADPHRNSLESNYDHEDPEETPFLYGFATTAPTRPFATSFKPTLTLRALALILALPSFIIFVIHGPLYAGVIVFLSFAIVRQVLVLGSHFGSQFVHIKIEVLHPRLKDVSARAQESWVQKSAAATIDGVILLGLLITLSLVAHQVDVCGGPCDLPPSTTAAVILGFIAFGLLLLSVPDFGIPSQLALAIAIEKPADGVVRLATSVVFGEEEEDAETNEYHGHHYAGKSHPRMSEEVDV